MGKKTDQKPVDLWAIVERSVREAQQSTSQPSVEAASRTLKTPNFSKRDKILLVMADLICAAFWTYLFTATFLVDIGTSFQRLMIVLGIVFVVSVFRWKWWTLLVFGYVFFFPLIVVFWKVPRFIYKRKSLLLAIVSLNGIALLFKNLRYNLITKTSGLVAAIIILKSSNRYLLMIAGAYVFLLLCWASVRTLLTTVHSDWFLRLHKRGFEKILNSGMYKAITAVDEKLLSGELQVLDATQLSSFNMAITARMTANRGMLLWAYGLQKYRQARLGMAFNGLAYATMFVGALTAVWFINLVILKVDPQQFSYVAHPSNITMLLYSLSSFALSDGGGVAAVGDATASVRIFAGIYAFLFLGAFLVNLIMACVQRDDSSLQDLVETLRAEAKKEEERFQSQYAMGIADAHQKLVGLQQKMVGLVTLLTSAIPQEFLEEATGPLSSEAETPKRTQKK